MRDDDTGDRLVFKDFINTLGQSQQNFIGHGARLDVGDLFATNLSVVRQLRNRFNQRINPHIPYVVARHLCSRRTLAGNCAARG